MLSRSHDPFLHNHSPHTPPPAPPTRPRLPQGACSPDALAAWLLRSGRLLAHPDRCFHLTAVAGGQHGLGPLACTRDEACHECRVRSCDSASGAAALSPATARFPARVGQKRTIQPCATSSCPSHSASSPRPPRRRAPSASVRSFRGKGGEGA